jgi:hypothetical protein
VSRHEECDSSVKSLHLCGASTLSHGVGGASLSGLFAAQRALGLAKADDLLAPADGSLRIYPADRPQEWLASARDPKTRTSEGCGVRSIRK